MEKDNLELTMPARHRLDTIRNKALAQHAKVIKFNPGSRLLFAVLK